MLQPPSPRDFVDLALKTSRKSDKKGRPAWDLPVTKAYYQKLGEKVTAVYRNSGYSDGFVDQMLEYLTNYMRDSYMPMYLGEHTILLFQSLRLDVDAAIERSARARQRAAQRRARKEAVQQTVAAPKNATPADKTIVIATKADIAAETAIPAKKLPRLRPTATANQTPRTSNRDRAMD